MRGGQCAEEGCTYVGMRMICYICITQPETNERAAALAAEAAILDRHDNTPHKRCSRHDVEHRHQAHGIVPVELRCAGCQKPLGTHTDTRSKAGAPWCGDCPPWWHE